MCQGLAWLVVALCVEHYLRLACPRLAAIGYVILLSALVARRDDNRIVVRGPLVEQVVFLLLWALATPAIV